jgi:transcriptional regulator
MYDGGIRARYYYDEMVASERNALIVRLRRKGWSQTKIGRRLGLTQQGVSEALLRIAEGRPGRGSARLI